MRRIHSIVLLVIILFSHSLILTQNVDDIVFYTEDYPPYNFVENGQLKGLSVELIVLMLERLGSKLTVDDILVYPWARGYNTIKNTPNTCLFAMQKIEERENLFKWVGPILPNRIVLIAKKDSNIVINSIEDLKQYKIGVIRGDIGELLLKEKGLSGNNVYDITFPWQIAKVLNAGRIDLWAYGEPAANWILNKNGFSSEDFETVYKLRQGGDNFFAFHKDTSDELIMSFQKALDDIKAEGIYDKILAKYLKNTY